MKNLTTVTAKELGGGDATLVFEGRKLRIFSYEALSTPILELNKKRGRRNLGVIEKGEKEEGIRIIKIGFAF